MRKKTRGEKGRRWKKKEVKGRRKKIVKRYKKTYKSRREKKIKLTNFRNVKKGERYKFTSLL